MGVRALILLFFVTLNGCSVMDRPLNSKNNSLCYPEAVKEILRWNKINGKTSKGLSNRRQNEYELFMSGCKK